MQWRRILIRAFLMLWLGATVAGLGQLLRRGERTRASACGQEPEAESRGTQAASGTLSTIQATITRRAGATASATEGIRIAARRPERTTAPARTKHCAISPPISAPGCGDFISAGKIFPPRGAGILRSDCAASKTYPRWNVNAPWTRCHSGVGLDPDERQAVLDFIERLPHSN